MKQCSFFEFTCIFLLPSCILLLTLMEEQYIIHLIFNAWKKCQGLLLQAFHWGTAIFVKYLNEMSKIPPLCCGELLDQLSYPWRCTGVALQCNGQKSSLLK